MTKFLDYKNPVSNDNRIYSEEDLNNMSKAEMIKNHDALTAQSKMIGFPKNFDLAQSHNTVYVHSYFRQDGTFVHGYWRSVNRSGANEQEQNNNYAVTGNNTNIVSNQTATTGIDSNNLVLNGAVQKNGLLFCTYAFIIENILSKGFDYLEKNVDEIYNNLRNTPDYVLPDTKPNVNSNLIDSINFLANHLLNKNNQDAAQLFEIALNKLKNYSDNNQFTKIKNTDLAFIIKKYELPQNLSINLNMDGLFFAKNSGFAKRISKSPEFQSTILNAFNPKTRIFNTDKILVSFEKDANLAYAIGHATVFNPHITKDGYVEGILFDIYDFKFIPPKGLASAANDYAVGMHKLNKCEYYYFFVPIRFKLSR